MVAPVSKQRKTKWATVTSWFFAVFLISCVSWACLFSILANHTDVAREVIYPKLSAHFPSMHVSNRIDKAGARLFTYLGAFYLIPGTVGLACLWKGITLPRFSPWMVRHVFASPKLTRLEALLMGLFLAVQILAFVTRVVKRFDVEYWETERVWYEISKTLGKSAALTMTVLLLPVSKNCFWWDLLNLHFERVVNWHKFLGWFLALVVALHGVTAVVALLVAGQFQQCMLPSSSCQKPGGWVNWRGEETSRIYTYGWMAMLMATPLAITSLPWFRRRKFEWFYCTHFLFIPFMVLIHMHYRDMIYYASPGLAAYALDKLLWFYSSRQSSKIASITQPAPGFIRLVTECYQTFEAGQWVQIRIPAVSTWEWHPMSVASTPGHSTICLDIKVVGDWTRSVARLAAKFDPRNEAHAKVYVDRFYGSSHHHMQGYLTHPAILLFAGGIGVTPMMSALRTLMEDCDANRFQHIHRIVLVWCVKKVSTIELYRKELAHFQTLGETNSGCRVDIIVHATLSEKEDEGEQIVVFEKLKPPKATPFEERTEIGGPRALRQRFTGYGHSLVLTTLAGGGYALGIYVANVLGREKDWRVEFQSLLQLMFAHALTMSLMLLGLATLAFFVLGGKTNSQNTEVDVFMEDQLLCSTEESEQLEVITGCRPDVQAIVQDMEAYCEDSGITSVGVSVCGPKKLVEIVIRRCQSFPSGSVDFVVEDESFDW